MTVTTRTPVIAGGLKLELSAAVYNLVTCISDYRAYRRTIAELSSLDNRELADMGLTRWNIPAIAHETVYGTRA